jgi:hypothetical protein
MCFSATASFTSGLAVGALGVATLPLVADRRERPFAALGVVFGIHQLLEGAVWLHLDAGDPTSIHDPAAAAWLLIAWTVLPVWVPLAVARFEPDRIRRRAMYGLAAIGAVVGVWLFAAGLAGSTTVTVDEHHLVYTLAAGLGVLAVPYVLATCGSMLLSTHRFVVMFGVALVTSMAATLVVAAVAFSSVWCFFAAVLSIGLYIHYRLERASGVHRTDLLTS